MDTLEFDAWRPGVEAQLRENADWFTTNDQQINYIMRCLAGKASSDTTPLLKQTNPERPRNVKEMLDHIES